MSLAHRLQNRIQVITPQDRRRTEASLQRNAELGRLRDFTGGGFPLIKDQKHPDGRADFRPRFQVEGLEDSYVDERSGSLTFRDQLSGGYVLDLNGNGRYDRGKDTVLAFDFNGDGKYDKNDVARTNAMMKAAAGDFDFDRDGKVSGRERRLAERLLRAYNRMDKNRDGKLDASELSAAGGRAWTDRDGDGQIGNSEVSSLNHVWTEDAVYSLDAVDPNGGARVFKQFDHRFPSRHGHGRRL